MSILFVIEFHDYQLIYYDSEHKPRRQFHTLSINPAVFHLEDL